MKRARRFIVTIAALLLLGTLVPVVAADGPAAERVLPGSITVNQQFEVEFDVMGATVGQVIETLPQNFSYVTTDSDKVQCEIISGIPEGGVRGVVTGNGEAKFTFFASSLQASFKYFVTAPANAVTGAAFSGILKAGPEEQYDVGGHSTMDVVAGEPDETAPAPGAPGAPSNPSPANGAANIATSVALSALASDPNGDAMTVTFYDSNNNVIGTASNVASGTRASATWSGLQLDTQYRWYARANDGELDSPKSSTWSFATKGAPGGTAPGNFSFTWYMAVIIALAVAVVASLILILVRRSH